MKNIKYFILTLLATTVLYSCSDGFLKEDVYDFKTNVNFYLTAEDADQAMVGTYKYLADFYRQSMIEPLTQNTGAFLKNRTTVYMSGAYGATEKEITQTWQNGFKLINGCNDVIYNVNKMGDDIIDADVKNSILGEARFLRGWAYFVLVRMYMNLPIKLEPTQGFEDAMVGLSSSEDIYEQVIVPDLEFAMDNLPYTRVASDNGRVTKGAAAAALAKVYMTRAGYNPMTKEFSPSASDYWVKARDYAKFVMDSCNYSLVPDFAKLWELGNKNTSESILEVQYLRGVVTGSAYSKIFTPSKSGLSAKGGGWGRARMTQKSYDDFAGKYPGDYRIVSTIVNIDGLSGYNDIKKNKFVPVYPTKKYKKNQSWPYIAKWTDPDAPDNFAADNNFIVIRYADVLLMFAEAENEVNGGPTDAAYDAVDMVLERARNGDGSSGELEQPANWERTLTQDEFREAVFNERHFELMGELKLWFDLVRLGWDKFRTFKEEDNAHGYKPAALQAGIYERNMYYPIPSLEISSNDAISVTDQNPGY